ncbi:MAG: hypothetical protein ABJA82_03995 [Myxococcales bacterium]
MNMKTKLHSNVAVLAVSLVMALAVGGRASAQESVAPPDSSSPPVIGGSVGYFGEHGQIAISGDMKFNLLHESRSMNGGSTTSFLIQPALDYFVSTNVSVGGLVGLQRDPEFPGHSTTIFIGPRVGYNIGIGSAASLWIRLSLTYEHTTYVDAVFPGSGYAIPLELHAPFLWHPVPHFFLGVGPSLRTDLVAKFEGRDSYKRTDIGVESTVGGYFGGL